MKGKKRIFITGCTGTMGSQTLKALLQRSDRFLVRALVLDTHKERLKMAAYKNRQNLEVVFGDMRHAGLIERCIRDVQVVLHIGALVSPMADKHPGSCMDVNYGSTVNIINAIIGTIRSRGCPFLEIGRLLKSSPGGVASLSS